MDSSRSRRDLSSSISNGGHSSSRSSGCSISSGDSGGSCGSSGGRSGKIAAMASEWLFLTLGSLGCVQCFGLRNLRSEAGAPASV